MLDNNYKGKLTEQHYLALKECINSLDKEYVESEIAWVLYNARYSLLLETNCDQLIADILKYVPKEKLHDTLSTAFDHIF